MEESAPLWSEDEKGNGFWFLFSNNHSLSTEEIRQIFSEYGTVSKINELHGETGLRFVQFMTQEEADKANEGLKDHPKLPFKRIKRKNKHNENGSSNKNGEGRSKTYNMNDSKSIQSRCKPNNFKDLERDVKVGIDKIFINGDKVKEREEILIEKAKVSDVTERLCNNEEIILNNDFDKKILQISGKTLQLKIIKTIKAALHRSNSSNMISIP